MRTLVFLAAVSVSGLLDAREPVQAKPPKLEKKKLSEAEKPAQRVVIFTPQGPVVAELQIYIDGKGFRMVREKIVDELMGIARPKGRGLTWVNALARPGFALAYANSYRTLAARQSAARRYDLNQNSWVDRAEVRAFVNLLAAGSVFNVRPSYNNAAQPNVSKVLDTNGDGMLSPAEIKAAPDRLKSRDADDNDLVTIGEVGGTNPRQMYYVRGRYGRQVGSTDVFALGQNAQLTTVYSMMKTRYGGAAKFIRKSSFKADPALFDKLDLNKNKRIDSGEMVSLHLAKPAITIEIRMGTDPKGTGARIVSAGTSLTAKPGKTVAVAATASLPGWQVRIETPKTNPYRYDYSRTAATYITRYDADKNGYLSTKDVEKLGNAGRFLQSNLTQWDLDSDGKVYKDEITKFYNRSQAPRMAQVSLTAAKRGPSLFTALDETGDSRLSLREIRTAAKRLLKLDRNKNGKIDPTEMPSGLAITVYQGSYYYPSRIVRNPRGTPARPTVRRGPRWFYHMDRNGDGDITLREFLGTQEQFTKLDSNKDGFVELAEAQAASGG